MRTIHLTDQFLSVLLGWPLDRQLAAGRPPESSPLLAARAWRIIDSRWRDDLARYWEHAAARARRPSASHPLALPLCRDRVIAAEPDIRELASRLRAPLPTSPRGVAAARLLLTDGAGPLYNAAPPDESLALQLRTAIALLEPAATAPGLACA